MRWSASILIPVLYSKFFYHQDEIYVPVLVCPESLCDFFWCIAVGFDVFLECFMIHDPCLYHEIHTFLKSVIYIAVNFLVVQVILINYHLGSKVDCYLVIFVILH